MPLPSSWSHERISSITAPVSNIAPKRRGEGNFQYIDISSIDNEQKIIATPKLVANRDAPSRARQLLRPGDVLVSTVRPNLNAVALVPDEYDEAICSTGFCVLRAQDKDICPEYIYHWARSRQFIDRLASLAKGAGYPAVLDRDVLDSPIPLPPIREQERIVQILNKGDELLCKRRAATVKSRSIASTLFFEMFGDPIINRNGYKRIRFDQAGELERGVSKHRPRDAGFLFSGQYPFIQTGDVSNSGGWIMNYTQTYSDEGLKQSRLWSKGTLCITIAANIAKTGILTFDACFPDSVVGFVPADGMTTEYAMFFLDSVQKRLEEDAPQAAQKNINLKILRDLLIPVPPYQDIALFSARVQKLRSHLDRLSSNMIQIEGVLSELRLRAFTGEITKAWRFARGIEENSTKPTGRMSVKITESAAEEWPWQNQARRRWLATQINELQSSVRLALQEWKGTLVPTEDMESFVQSWPIEELTGHEDRIKRALNELAGLGLIARTSIPNARGDYVTAYRGLREDELSRVDDLEAIKSVSGDK